MRGERKHRHTDITATTPSIFNSYKSPKAWKFSDHICRSVILITVFECTLCPSEYGTKTCSQGLECLHISRSFSLRSIFFKLYGCYQSNTFSQMMYNPLVVFTPLPRLTLLTSLGGRLINSSGTDISRRRLSEDDRSMPPPCTAD